ncbi:tetratricopeptide repeat protein [Desulfococcus sp.]|uniref:tetratricopeptide repeat protein n=1 Tax=Desulfococcus sp. TaxID=2025834 RepID=UPI003594521B
MHKIVRSAGMLAFLMMPVPDALATSHSTTEGYAGSRSCMACHERFYQLWSTSFHGLAMQPYTRELASAKLSPQRDEIAVGDKRYRVELSGNEGWVQEIGVDSRRRYRIEHVLGGKNVYYFLTLMEKGRLQTLPIAYDVNQKEWFDTAASGIRHFPDRSPEAENPVDWKDWRYTFNTACFNCHVSQLSTNYDLKTDTYATVWREPGINCETCHGPSEAHNRLFQSLPEGAPSPADPKIISVKKFTSAQHNEACSSCHAKASPISAGYVAGEGFFDHFDPVTLESPDFYPDGRDLGENYTFATWRMSPCAAESEINCITCHTSSGRYRFKAAEKANEACLPCHQNHVGNPTAHTHHKMDSPGSHCVSCHMPATWFARMRRSDHSMRPPAPAATIAFKSPNACNNCHADKTAQWADQWVRRWRPRDYQAPVLYEAGLIEAARRRDWKRLPEMLEGITAGNRNEIFANSMLRLLRASDDERIGPVLLEAIKDPSPLIRSSAATSLGLMPSAAGVQALAAAASDGRRLVRVRAAQALSGIPDVLLEEPFIAELKKATEEYLASITARPDEWTSHYNLGNYHLDRQEHPSAIAAYETAIRFDPSEVPPWVNLSIARARLGDNAGADEALRKALSLEPDNAEANFNMGLLKVEQNDPALGERHLRRALETDPRMAPAAYNLCILLGGKKRLTEALGFCRRAAELRPLEPRYTWTYAYYQHMNGESKAAAAALMGLIARRPDFADGYLLLADIYIQLGDPERAVAVYTSAVENHLLNPEDLSRIKAVLDRFKAGGHGTISD